MRKIGEVVGWRGEVMTVPAGRIPLAYDFGQDLDADSDLIRAELGYAQEVSPQEALERTIAWERANPPDQAADLGLLGYEAEDVLLAEIGLGRHREA